MCPTLPITRPSPPLSASHQPTPSHHRTDTEDATRQCRQWWIREELIGDSSHRPLLSTFPPSLPSSAEGQCTRMLHAATQR